MVKPVKVAEPGIKEKLVLLRSRASYLFAVLPRLRAFI